MGDYLKNSYQNCDMAKTLALSKKLFDDDYKKLSDKYEKLKKSHKTIEKLIMDFRNFLIAYQNNIEYTLCPKCAEKRLRKINLALGYNQWECVKPCNKEHRT